MNKIPPLPEGYESWLEIYHLVARPGRPDDFIFEILPRIQFDLASANRGIGNEYDLIRLTFREVKLNAFEELMQALPSRKVLDNALGGHPSGFDDRMLVMEKLDPLVWPQSEASKARANERQRSQKNKSL